MNMTEKRTRSLAKSISYRMVSSLVTGGIFFGATHKGRLALSVALVDSFAKIILFYLHERAWTKIAFAKADGPREETETNLTLEPSPTVAYESLSQ